jgi:hypothetical protein
MLDDLKCFNNTFQSKINFTTKSIQMVIYSVNILFRREEATTWARLASPAVSRKHYRVQTKY